MHFFIYDVELFIEGRKMGRKKKMVEIEVDDDEIDAVVDEVVDKLFEEETAGMNDHEIKLYSARKEAQASFSYLEVAYAEACQDAAVAAKAKLKKAIDDIGIVIANLGK
jgi:hypothetical protein